jgi:hypothetical protein
MPAPSRSSALAALALAVLFVWGAPAHAETTVLENFTLFDGTGRPAVPKSAMILRDGRVDDELGMLPKSGSSRPRNGI